MDYKRLSSKVPSRFPSPRRGFPARVPRQGSTSGKCVILPFWAKGQFSSYGTASGEPPSGTYREGKQQHSLAQKSSSGRQIAAESIPVMVLDLDGLLLEEREEGRKTPVPGDDGLLPSGLGLAGW